MRTPKQKMTLDTLAVLINNGFKNTATKTELAAVKTDIASVKRELKDDIEGVKADIARVRSEMEAGFEKISKERNYAPGISQIAGLEDKRMGYSNESAR